MKNFKKTQMSGIVSRLLSFGIITCLLVLSAYSKAADPASDLEKAKKDGKTVFLVITGTGATDVDKANKLAKDVSAKVPKSTVLTLNRDEAANSGLVTKFGIANVAVPFIFIISHNGIPVGGYPYLQATTDNLIKAVPSPVQDQVLLALSEKKPVFIIVSKKGFTDKAKLVANCKTASSKIATKPSVVEVDYSDPKEANFLSQIGVTSITDKSKTVVVGAAGKITDTFEGEVDVAKLTASATKVIKSGGCCPGGSSSGCGKKK
ncbi:MAG: hypothetical protein NTW49_00530 [Bacteroidia bacterium]|nr:hypothetical protein [Bacteroidia bacterium]